MPITQTQARHNLHHLVDDYYHLTAEEKARASEADVLKFIERLFHDVLGWPTDDISKFKREQSLARGFCDRILILDNDAKIFIEAKRFGLIKRLSNSNEWAMRPGQLALPGMATDRTKEEQQAINYAFENGGTWAILCNFECLRLFNARRDWLITAFEAPAAYKDDFDLLWQLSWHSIHSGSLERLSSQRVLKEVDADYLAFINEQREQLAIDITLNRDRNPWAFTPDGSLRLTLLRAVVQRFLDRLVVIRFAEDHYVIKGSPLRKAYDNCKDNLYTEELQDNLNTIFKKFNQLHNSALFAPSEVDEARFTDETLFPLIEKLYEARFRAMPADIIGNTYEQYLGKALTLEDGAITIRDNLETRKAQGSYYTPQYIVRFIVDHTLGRYLYATTNGKPDGPRIPDQQPKTAADIRDLRLLDSACGSGSFLIYAYQVLADFYKSEVQRLTDLHDQAIQQLAAKFADLTIDDRVHVQRIELERDHIRDSYPRLILERHLYGVDLDPQAAEIAVMNLILRALEGSGHTDKLPLILNQNIKVGNSLIGLRPHDPRLSQHAPALANIRALRAQLLDSPHTDPRHAKIQAELESATKALSSAFQSDCAPYSLPFHWTIQFPEVFVDEQGLPLDSPGFHFVFGNPPYSARLTPQERAYFRQAYSIGMTNTAGLFMAHAQEIVKIDTGGGARLHCS